MLPFFKGWYSNVTAFKLESVQRAVTTNTWEDEYYIKLHTYLSNSLKPGAGLTSAAMVYQMYMLYIS